MTRLREAVPARARLCPPVRRPAPRAGHPADGADQAPLEVGEAKGGGHGGQNEAQGHLIVGVKRPTAEGCPERGATGRGEGPVPFQLRADAGARTRSRLDRLNLHDPLLNSAAPRGRGSA
jgi:hypothetical protein